MPGPPSNFIVNTSLASADDGNSALRLEQLRLLIKMVDAVQGVRHQGGEFKIEPIVLDLFDRGYHQLIAAAVARANADPLAATAAAKPSLMSDEDLGKVIERIGNGAAATPELVAQLKAVFSGTSFDPDWWGITLRLTQASANNLVTVLSTDLSLLALLAPVIPHALAVIAVVNAAGKGLGGWIKASNGPRGILIHLYFWIVPWVESQP